MLCIDQKNRHLQLVNHTHQLAVIYTYLVLHKLALSCKTTWTGLHGQIQV